MGNLNHGGTKDTEENRGLGSLFLKKLLLEVIALQPVPQPGRPPVRPGQGQSKPVKPVPVAKHPRTENRDPKPKTPKQVKVGQAQSSLSRP